MEKWNEILETFILQAIDGGLKTSLYPKDYSDLKMKVSFGIGNDSILQEFSINTKKRISDLQLDWQNNVKKFDSLYNSIIVLKGC